MASSVTEAELRAAWGTMTVTAISREYKMKPSRVRWLATMYGLEGEGPDDDDPTPSEIAERAAEVRKKWSEHEEQRRSRSPQQWTPPSIYR
jgi:hypothetical protein